MRRHKIVFCHHFVNQFIHVALETQVAVGHNAHQSVVIINNWNATDVIIVHHGQCFLDRTASSNRHRVVDHAVFCPLYDGNMAGLVFYGHVFMNDTDATFACNSYGHGRLSDCIHGRSHERYVQNDVTCELGS